MQNQLIYLKEYVPKFCWVHVSLKIFSQLALKSNPFYPKILPPLRWRGTSALWDLTPLFQLYGGQKTNFLIWTVLGEIITVLTCIWLVRTASSLRLAETNSADPFFFSAVLAPI